MRRVALALAVAAVLAGCSPARFQQARAPNCEDQGRPGSSAVLLMAQAVPTATLLPCIELLPAGWGWTNLQIADGRAQFWLTSDRTGARAVEVDLTPACDVSGASRVSSDEPGTHRFERVRSVASGYVGTRYYLFDGGCVTYRFDLQGTTFAEPVTQATRAVSFVSRATIDADLRKQSRGYLHLNPPTTT